MGYKGTSKKQAITADDLAELADIYRRLQRIHSSLNPVSSEILPLMAASATVKACWAELSGKAMCWSFPIEALPQTTMPKTTRAGGEEQASAQDVAHDPPSVS